MTFAETTPPQEGAAAVRRDARALLALAVNAAEAAAAVIRAAEPGRAKLNWREKGVADFVTEVDVNAEQAAMEILRAAEPSATFIAEETASTRYPLPSTLQFIIDPLDGTTHCRHGFPEYAVSIGVQIEGALAAGVVLNVPRNECFTAFAGGGAWLSGEGLRVSETSDAGRALIGTGFPFRTPDQIPSYLQQMSRVMLGTAGIRRPGAASIDLANVAAGRLDGFWENYLAPWDVAAGILLVREAGGVCTDPLGAPSRAEHGAIVAGNTEIHAWLLGAVREER